MPILLETIQPTPVKKDPAAVQANLFEQLGTTAPINKVKSFLIALPVGASEAPIDPLPDTAEIS